MIVRVAAKGPVSMQSQMSLPSRAAIMGWSPACLVGCLLLLDPLVKTMSTGSALARFGEGSTRGNDATPTGSPVLTRGQINNLPAVTLVKASSQYLALPNVFGSLTSAEIFIVCKSTTTTSGLHNFGNVVGQQQLYPFSDNHIYDNFGSNARPDCGAAPGAISSYHLFNARTAANAFSLFINNNAQFSTGVNTVAWGVGPALGGSTGGGAANPTTFFDGGVAYCNLHDHVLSTAERTQELDFIRNKFGLTIS